MTSCLETVTSLSYFQFMVNFEQSRSRILDAESAKITFSLIVTFYFTKTESRTEKYLTQLSQYCSRQYFCQKKCFFAKKLLTSAKVNNGTLKSIVSLHRILLKKVNTEIFVQFMRKKHSRGKILLINHLRISFTCISDHDTISFCPGLILLYSS